MTSPSPAAVGPESTADDGDAGLHRDVAAAYLSAGARVLSWVIVSAVVFRWAVADYAMLGVVRYTIAILNYTSLGLAPAMIRLLAESRWASSPSAPRPAGGLDSRSVYSNGLVIAAIAGGIGVIVTAVYAHWSSALLHIPASSNLIGAMPMVVWLMGLGTVLRLAGDAPGAWLQTRGRISQDNLFLAAGEAAWVVLFLLIGAEVGSFGIVSASASYCAAAVLPLVLRWASAAWLSGMILPDPKCIRAPVVWFLLCAGGAVVLAQVADYLYAPIDFVLINRFLDPGADAAAYMPVVQIGSALLLVSSGLAAALLPRSAVAHAAGNTAAVRRYYLRGTLLSTVMLAIVAAGIWLTLPSVLGLWLGKVIPETVDVMPIMLLASVVGGSGMVGRSVLIGTGKFRVFTASVLIAALGNVVISYLLVRYTGFGLAAVVLGTLAATAIRCMIWMPWYVLHTLAAPRRGAAAGSEQ